MKRKLLIRGALCLLLAGSLWVGLLFFLRWRETNRSEQELAEVVAELDATDPGWRWERILADYPEVPREERSAELAASFERRTRPSLVTWEQRNQLDEKLNANPRNHILPDELACELWTVWEGNWPDLEVSEEIVRRRHVGKKMQLTPDVISTLMGHIQGHRSAVEALRLDAQVHLQTNDPAKALARCAEMVSIAAQLRDEPLLISHLVRFAVLARAISTLELILARAQFPDHAAELGSLRDAFTREANLDALKLAFRGERACLDRLFRNIEEEGLSVLDASRVGSPSGSPSTSEWMADYRYAPVVAHDHAVMLRYMTRLLEACEKPRWERQKEAEAIPYPEAEFNEMLSGSLMISEVRMIRADQDSAARLNAVRIALACERFRLARGRWPATMSELKDELPDGPPLDPFSGNPMRFQAVPEGLIIPRSRFEPPRDSSYAVATETTPEDAKPYFRLWNPELRGLPAVPVNEQLPTPEVFE